MLYNVASVTIRPSSTQKSQPGRLAARDAAEAFLWVVGVPRTASPSGWSAGLGLLRGVPTAHGAEALYTCEAVRGGDAA